jgi:2-phospho-L-lactate guanylyltransferase
MLDKEARAQLSLTMLLDVLTALCRTRRFAEIVLVTRDVRGARLGTAKGARILPEGHSRGLNRAVRKGIRLAEREGVDQVLIIPADVPLVRPMDLERILRAGREKEVVIVPSYDEGGTNALLLSPPTVMPVAFGRDSFRRHCRVAQNRNLRVRVLRLRSLQLDVDTPSDLKRLRLTSGNTKSQTLLRRQFQY